MKTFLIRLERYSTLEEVECGAWYKKAKNILVQCKDEGCVDSEIKKFKTKEPEHKDYKCVDIQDWDALGQAQTMANMQWILNATSP